MNRRGSRHVEDRSPDDGFGRGVWVSVGMHVGLAVLLVTSPSLFPDLGSDLAWGSPEGGGMGISVNLVASVSGVPLPTPEFTREDAVGNDSSGLNEPLPEPEVIPPAEEPPADADLIPETFGEVAEVTPDPDPAPAVPAPTPDPPAATPRPATPSRPAAEARPTADNAVPFGEGGQPGVTGGIGGSQGTGADFEGDGLFGVQHGQYVNALQRRISGNWQQSRINASIRSAPRVTVEFEILRDGRLRNVQVLRSSGIRDVDDSALRAVLASDPVAPLPAAYRGASITVNFWFELRR